jgi:hypothetical protein
MKLIQRLVDNYNRHCEEQNQMRLKWAVSKEVAVEMEEESGDNLHTKYPTVTLKPQQGLRTTTKNKSRHTEEEVDLNQKFSSSEPIEDYADELLVQEHQNKNIYHTSGSIPTTTPKILQYDRSSHQIFASDRSEDDMKLIKICAKKFGSNFMHSLTKDTSSIDDNHNSGNSMGKNKWNLFDFANEDNQKDVSLPLDSSEDVSNGMPLYAKLSEMFRKHETSHSKHLILKELEENENIFLIKKQPVYIVALKCAKKKNKNS